MSLELIVGPMFAGKSSAILSIVKRYKTIGWPIMVITHSCDTRYSTDPVIISHDGLSTPAKAVSELMTLCDNKELIESKVIIVEEAQFFPDLVEFVNYVVDKCEKEMIVVGLDGTAKRQPFGQIGLLLPICDKITKLTALCKSCNDGTKAIFTHAHKPTGKEVYVGGMEIYTPVCRKHYNILNS